MSCVWHFQDMMAGLFNQILETWSTSLVKSWLCVGATGAIQDKHTKLNLKMSPHSPYVSEHLELICFSSVSPFRLCALLDRAGATSEPQHLPWVDAQTSFDNGCFNELTGIYMWRILQNVKKGLDTSAYAVKNRALGTTCVFFNQSGNKLPSCLSQLECRAEPT